MWYTVNRAGIAQNLINGDKPRENIHLGENIKKLQTVILAVREFYNFILDILSRYVYSIGRNGNERQNGILMIPTIYIALLETEEERSFASSLFSRYQNAMYWTAFRILKNRSDTEEAVMNAVEHMCSHIHDFDGLSEQHVKRLLKRMTENAAIDIYRKNKKRPVDVADFWDGEEDDYDLVEAEDISFPEEDLGRLQKHVLKLKPKYKTVLLLRYVEQMSNKEIADLLGCPESTIGTQLQRARDFLKAELEKEAENRGKM